MGYELHLELCKTELCCTRSRLRLRCVINCQAMSTCDPSLCYFCKTELRQICASRAKENCASCETQACASCAKQNCTRVDSAWMRCLRFYSVHYKCQVELWGNRVEVGCVINCQAGVVYLRPMLHVWPTSSQAKLFPLCIRLMIIISHLISTHPTTTMYLAVCLSVCVPNDPSSHTDTFNHFF